MKNINVDIPNQVQVLWNCFEAEGFETRIVGGFVRDAIMGIKPKDMDFCTTATPDEMMNLANKFSFRIEPTGLQHGTISFIIDGEAFEFTTLRIDTNQDGRHADVEFTKSFKEDAARRDFTINAMSIDIHGNVHDFFGGAEDIAKSQLKFVGDSESRIREDFLRVLRFFRFASRFNMNMDKQSLDFMSSEEVHNGLKTISRERIWSEVSKIATSNHRGRIIAEMSRCGISDAIGMVPNWMTMKCIQNADDAPTFMAGFCGRRPDQFARDWKMSTDEREKMSFIFHTQSLGHWTKEDMISDMLDQVQQDWVASASKIWDLEMPTFEIPVFATTGKDLMEEGFTQGKAMGDELKRRRAEWKMQQMKDLS